MTETKNGWFEVDRAGLAKLLEDRGKAVVIIELVQNAWDSAANEVEVRLEPVPGAPLADLVVRDNDPEGFLDLRHAFTLFAESCKKGDPTKRGRFNLGEKLVLALCTYAEVASTSGTYIFDPKAGRSRSRKTTDSGSVFSGKVRMTRAEYEECCDVIRSLIPPPGVRTTFNGDELEPREPITEFEAALPTELGDEEGNLRRTIRNTTVRIYEPGPDEEPSIYELGIPVVETGDKWHVDVQQKVPLNWQRDNVTPGYLKQLRVLTLNAMHEHLEEEDANDTWVREATSDSRCSDAAICTAIKHRYGDRVVAADPTDPESRSRAVSEGYTVLSGGHLSGGEWANVKRAGIVESSGRKFPTASLKFTDDPDAPPLNTVEKEKWTEGMQTVARFTRTIIDVLLPGKTISISIINEFSLPLQASYGNRHLRFNVARLGRKWFNSITADTVELIIHELAHEFCEDHLSADYHRALTRLGVQLALAATENPSLLEAVQSSA